MRFVAKVPTQSVKNAAFRLASEIAYTEQMKWTLLVPGALVPGALAPDLARAAPVSRLTQLLSHAQPTAQHQAAEGGVGAAHWSWLARTFGLNSDPPVSAAYAWQALGGTQAELHHCWIAFCDPVHMALGPDSVTLNDTVGAPLGADETEALLSLAREVLGEVSLGTVPKVCSGTTPAVQLRLEVRGGQWFILADAPIDLQTTLLDAVLGKSAQERLPNGSDARLWRKLTNQIQMLWHASAVNVAREQRGTMVVNALWVHGGGQWRRLPRSTITKVQAPDNCIDAAVLRGWLMAGRDDDVCGENARREEAQGDMLSICRVLFRPFAFQDWESWLTRLTLLEEHLERDLAAARACGATRFELIVCGARQTRTLTIPLQAAWWQRLRVASRSSAPALQRWFAEADVISEQTL